MSGCSPRAQRPGASIRDGPQRIPRGTIPSPAGVPESVRTRDRPRHTHTRSQPPRTDTSKPNSPSSWAAPAATWSPPISPAAVAGYTIGNDITAVDQIPLDEMINPERRTANGSSSAGGSKPTSTTDLPMAVHVNGKQVAAADTGQLARNITEILVYLTDDLTLGPGDIGAERAAQHLRHRQTRRHPEIRSDGIEP